MIGFNFHIFIFYRIAPGYFFVNCSMQTGKVTYDIPATDTDQLKAALRRTYYERLLFATRLYKIQQTLKKASIKHKPYTLKK